MSTPIRPTRVLADLAQGDLASLLAFLSGQGTSGTSLAAEFSLPRLGRIVPTGPKKRKEKIGEPRSQHFVLWRVEILRV